MSTPAPASSSTPSAAKAPGPEPTAAQQRVLERIAAQRARLRAQRAAQALAMADQGAAAGGAGAAFAPRAARFAREHPLALAALVGVAAAAGPRRLMRWAGIWLPLWLRLRR